MKPSIGLLPLYLSLYDEARPDNRQKVEPFVDRISEQLEQRGLRVETAAICRKRPEFEQAVERFEKASVDAIVTLHLAYSPSLESAPVLAATRLPVILLDTTPDYEFGPEQDPAAIMLNHGIHGVQDLCNLLIRMNKPFHVEAGHWKHSDVLDRIAGWARSAGIASSMRSARVGLIGEAFQGMGDFDVPRDILRSDIGVETVVAKAGELKPLVPAADSPEVEAEWHADRNRFRIGDLDPRIHRDSIRAGLAVRRWLDSGNMTGFSINFLSCDKASGLPTMPFLEISKAMARGTGYGGEGDVLTASLSGALASAFPETTFTEMFCPDWAGNRVFLSHMGEVNCDLLSRESAHLAEKPFPWTDVANPACVNGCLRAGSAVLVNLAPGPDHQYTLILAPVDMLDGGRENRMKQTVHGWLRPEQPLDTFLEQYSRLGGTHHSALVYDRERIAEIGRFGDLMGWRVRTL